MKENKNIIKLIRELAFNLYSDNNVDCIYITNHHTDDGIIVCPTILLKDNTNFNTYRIKVNLINNNMKSYNNENVYIYCSVDYSYRYNPFSSKVIDSIRMDELNNSKIIFDKSGYITKVQNLIVNRNSINCNVLTI